MASDTDSNKGKVKLVIYDFDQTITKEHLYHVLAGGHCDELKKMSDERLVEVFGGSQRVQRLKVHFSRVTQAKAQVVIVSYGYAAVIRKALERVGMNEYWKDAVVIGNDSDELRRVGGRKEKVVIAMRRKHSLKSSEVAFVDDDPNNIRQAANAKACLTVEIKARQGMTEHDLQTIEEYVGHSDNSNDNSTNNENNNSNSTHVDISDDNNSNNTPATDTYTTPQSQTKKRMSAVKVTSPHTVSREGSQRYQYSSQQQQSQSSEEKQESKAQKKTVSAKEKYKLYIPPEYESVFNTDNTQSGDGTPVINIAGNESPEPSRSESGFVLGTPVLPTTTNSG